MTDMTTLALPSPPKAAHHERAASMQIVLVIPLFNHAAAIRKVVDSLGAALAAAGETLPLIVVNDGSTDAPPLSSLRDRPFAVTVLTHPRNRGKGAALHTAFTHARQEGFTHAITVDADGQHDPADVLRILAAARTHPDDLILGQRDMDQAIVPRASRTGRNLSRFWMRLHTGCDLPDTQCGLRAYPLTPTLAVPQRFRRFDFETEILARLSWGGMRLRGVPIRCIYPPPEIRITHFRPVPDTLRGAVVTGFLVFRRLLPVPFRRLVRAAAAPAPRFGRWWKWASWRDAIVQALRAGSSNSALAMAFAMGIFVGLTPFSLLQTILAIYFARRMHLNVLAAVIGSQISIPPLAPLWLTASYALGRRLVDGQWTSEVFTRFEFSLRQLGPFLLGNLLLALIMTAVGLFSARALLYCVRSESLPEES